MNLNLDTLKSDIIAYLRKNDFLVFHGFAHQPGRPEIEWDSRRYPDFRAYLDVAKQLGVRLILIYDRELAEPLVEDAIDRLQSGYPFDEDGTLLRRLKEIRMYAGFTAALDLAFEHNGNNYLYSVETEWYEEFRQILDDLDMLDGEGPSEEDDGTLGGYYSKN